VEARESTAAVTVREDSGRQSWELNSLRLILCVFVRIVMRAMHSRDVLAALRADGWAEVAQKGSHVHLKHPVKAGRVTVPHPNRDLPIGTLRSIERQAQIKLR
jgi:predicted RNA binding protein YcfA (HicA-like mRNA interferase family)